MLAKYFGRGSELRRVAAAMAAVALAAALWLVASSKGGSVHSHLPNESVAIGCGQKTSVHPSWRPRVRPWRCFVTGTSGEAGVIVFLIHLRWSSWGGLKASARGYVLNPERGTRSAVKVLVYGRTSCEGKSLYRDLRLDSKGHTALKLRMLQCAS